MTVNTTFTDEVTPIVAAWLNSTNNAVQALPTDSLTGLIGYKASGGVVRTITSKLTDAFSVKDFGATGDGTTDDTAAIAAADAAACNGSVSGLDGVTVIAQKSVYFPPGNYKVTALTFRGAPWIGAGPNVTFIQHYASSGACIDAVGTNAARRLLSISDLTISGIHATGTAYGLRLGYNQRSFDALHNVRIQSFPGSAIYIAEPTWSMSFYDVYCAFNGNGVGSAGTAISHDPALPEGTLLAFDWFNLQLENNGVVGSGKGGGIELTSNAIYSWHFYGGVWEGNYGAAEARFANCVEIHLDGVYLEGEAAKITDGLVFNGIFGSVINCHLAGEIGMTGSAIKCLGACGLDVSQVLSNIKWVYDINLGGTSIVYLLGSSVLLFSVAAGCSLFRLAARRVQLTDAVTIAVNAAEGTSFYVTLSDNRTMGAPTNPSVGQRITFLIIQEPTLGAHTLAWNAVFKTAWSNTGNTTSKRSTIEFEYDGTNWNQVGAQSPYI